MTAHGSKRYFSYFSDDGTEYYMHLDEGTYEEIALGMGQAVTPAVLNDLSRRLRVSSKRPIIPRQVIVSRQANGSTITRRLVVGSTTAPIWTAPGVYTIDGDAGFSTTAYLGEQRFYPPASDTQQNDGDIESNVSEGT